MDIKVITTIKCNKEDLIKTIKKMVDNMFISENDCRIAGLPLTFDEGHYPIIPIEQTSDESLCKFFQECFIEYLDYRGYRGVNAIEAKIEE